jgi:aspartate aminotransferase
MPASPIRKLVPFAEAAKKRGTQVIHLNIGQPDIATPEVALDAIRHLDRTVIEYSHSAGYESYRKGLAAVLCAARHPRDGTSRSSSPTAVARPCSSA